MNMPGRATGKDSSGKWLWSTCQRIASDASLTSEVVEPLLTRLQEADWEHRDVFGIHLAIEEALVNAIKHGNGDDPVKCVQVEFRLAQDVVQIEITDQGSGFDPASIPDPTDAEHLEMPNGRGIMLMRSFMSRVAFNRTGNGVLLEKERSAE